MRPKAKSIKKIILTVLITLLVIAAVIAAVTGVIIYRIFSQDTLTLHGFSKQRTDGACYAHAENVHSPVLVSSDVDLSPYLTGQDTVLKVSGEVTKLQMGHQDVSGIYLPALTFDFRIHDVISDSEPVPEEQPLA